MHKMLCLDTAISNIILQVLLETEQDQKRFDMLTPTVVKPVTKDTYVENCGQISDGTVAESGFQVKCLKLYMHDM